MDSSGQYLLIALIHTAEIQLQRLRLRRCRGHLSGGKREKYYRLVQIECPKLCPREFLTPFFRVRPRNFAHVIWKAVSETRRGGFFNLGFRCRDIRVLPPPPGEVLQPGPRITGHRDKKLKNPPLRVLDNDVQNMCAKFRGLTRRNGVRNCKTCAEV